MGSTYGRLEERGPLIAHAGFVDLCMEYKDLQDALPPPLNVLLIPIDVLEFWFYLRNKCQGASSCCEGRQQAVSAADPMRFQRLQSLYGDSFSYWNQLNKGLSVLAHQHAQTWPRPQPPHPMRPPTHTTTHRPVRPSSVPEALRWVGAALWCGRGRRCVAAKERLLYGERSGACPRSYLPLAIHDPPEVARLQP